MKKHCVWFTFSSAELNRIISNLAQKYCSPVFQPHCTLIGKTDVSLSKLKSALIKYTETFKMIEISTADIAFSDSIWRSLYIEIDEKQQLSRYHRYICKLLDLKPDDEYLPHISIIYGAIPIDEKKRIAQSLQLALKYEISAIEIVDCSKKVESWKSVYGLKI